jgi:hypothetical protein
MAVTILWFGMDWLGKSKMELLPILK